MKQNNRKKGGGCRARDKYYGEYHSLKLTVIEEVTVDDNLFLVDNKQSLEFF